MSFGSTSATAPFSWTLPEQESKKPATSSPAAAAGNGKPISNPLLKQSFAAAQPTTNLPFSPVVQNNVLRQRRNKENLPTSQINNIPPNSSTDKRGPVRPPKASFLVNGDVGVSNDDVISNGTRTTTTTTTTRTVPVHDSLERWVLVYGYATSAEYDAVVRRFKSFGNVVSHYGTCQPGRATWIALEYESTVQVEKALCQSNGLLMDGIFLSVTRLTMPLKQILDRKSVPVAPLRDSDVASRLDDKFQTGAPMTEEDILILPSSEKQQQSLRRTVCERLVAWWFCFEYE